MPEQAVQEERNFYAVLIGINDYDRNTQKCSPLSGCVNDALAINDFFEKLCANQNPQIHWKPTFYFAPSESDRAIFEQRNLKAGNDENPERISEFYYRPTRSNIIKAFDHFEEADKNRGDLCLLYYSGHGSSIMADQAEIFADYEASGELQTIVCADRPRRDLLDKELGYLIARTLADKEPVANNNRIAEGVHFLAIMDCCHSGSNTRNENDSLVIRRANRSSHRYDFRNGDIHGLSEETLAEGNCFYQPFEKGQTRVKPHVGIKHARYISLSAARDTEPAVELEMRHPNGEKRDSGIFTYSLLKVLEKSGMNISYRELMDRVKAEVRSWVENQFPVLGKTHPEDDRLLFLGREFVNPGRQYRVSYRRTPVNEWWMNAGSIHGVVPSSPSRKTVVRVTDGNHRWKAWVREVRTTESTLEGPFAEECQDFDNTALEAVIEEMAFAPIKIGLGATLSEVQKNEIRDAWKRASLKYAALALDGAPARFEIHSMKDEFILCHTQGDQRSLLFVGQSDPFVFLANLEKTARFHHIFTMENPSPEAGAMLEDIGIEVQKLEGVKFSRHNIGAIDLKQYQAVDLNRGAELWYKKAGNDLVQPAIKIKISTASYKAYTVGAIYGDCSYGITAGFLPPTQIGGIFQSSVELKFRQGNEEYPAIPLNIPKALLQAGITEISEYFMLFISEEPEFDLSHFDQDGIELSSNRSTSNKRAAFTEEAEQGLNNEKWGVKVIPFRIIHPRQ